MMLVTAADPHYLFSYAPALIASCLRYRVPLRIEVIEPTKTCVEFVEKLKPLEKHGISLHLHIPTENRYERLATYCACRRFAAASWLLNSDTIDRVLVIDVDSFVRRPIPEFYAYDLGLWLRTQEREPGMQCLAGCSMFTRNSVGIAEMIYRNCERNRFSSYFADQQAIWSVFQLSAYSKVPETALYFIDFAKWSDPSPDATLIDWDFRAQSYIWTGKGPRKFTNTGYITEQNRLTAIFMELMATGFKDVEKSIDLLATT